MRSDNVWAHFCMYIILKTYYTGYMMNKEKNMQKMSEMLERMLETAYKNGNARPGDFQWAVEEAERLKKMEEGK